MTTAYFADTGLPCEPIVDCPTRLNGSVVCRCADVLAGTLAADRHHVESLHAGLAPLDERVAALVRLAAAAAERARPVLFQTGDFTLASGARSKWKIECDALTKADWAGLAAMAVQFLPPFGEVRGVPRGGLPFAEALKPYATAGVTRVLVAEDVVTTGGSIERYAASAAGPGLRPGEAIGVCVFARGRCPSWVTPLFQMPAAGPAAADPTSPQGAR